MDVDRTLHLRFLACPRLSNSGKDGTAVTGRVREFFQLVRESALTPASGPCEGSTPGSRAAAEMPTLGTRSGCVLLPSGSAQSILKDGEVIQRCRSGGPERLPGARCWVAQSTSPLSSTSEGGQAAAEPQGSPSALKELAVRWRTQALPSQRAARPGGPPGGRDAHRTPELQCSALLLGTEEDGRLDAAREPECLARVVSLRVHSEPAR